MTEEIVSYGVLSLIPAILAVVLAFWTKNVTIFVMFIGWGFPGQNIPGSKIRIALTSGYMLATIVLAIMVIVKKIMTFTEVVDTWVSGIKKMAGILAIIIAAWGVGSVCTALGTSQFVVDCTIGFQIGRAHV